MRFAPAFGLLLLFGCAEPKAPAPADTGAKEAARQFFAAACGPDPRTAYTFLDATSRKRTSEDRFVELAKKYTRNLGFGVEKVHVHASDEHGDDATAHLTLVGTGKRFEDGITLRRADGKWSAVLPANFGHATK